MTTKYFFKIAVVIITSLSLVGCTTHVYNYNPVDPTKKIEYDKKEDRILRQDGKVITYDEAIKFLSEQEYSKETMEKSSQKQLTGGILSLSSQGYFFFSLFSGLTIGEALVAVLGTFIGLGIVKSSRKDILKAVDQHNAHIEKSTPASTQSPQK